MKMFKKLMAVVLTGVMAVSMLTGCSLSDAVMANALEKALNSKEVQSTQYVKYDHDKDLDSKAAKVYTQIVEKKENFSKNTTNKLTYNAKLDNGTKKYAYYIVDTGVDAKGDLKKNDKWSASSLHNAIYMNTLVKSHQTTNFPALTGYVVKGSDKTADAAKVKFGVKIYDNGAEKKDNKTYYAIVVVELVENK